MYNTSTITVTTTFTFTLKQILMASIADRRRADSLAYFMRQLLQVFEQMCDRRSSSVIPPFESESASGTRGTGRNDRSDSISLVGCTFVARQGKQHAHAVNMFADHCSSISFNLLLDTVRK